MIKQITIISIVVSVLIGLSSCDSGINENMLESKEQALGTGSYNKNKFGVIEPERLNSYIVNWKKNKPKNVKGKLIILQAGKTSSGKFLNQNDKDVEVYEISEEGLWSKEYSRHDGITNIPGALFDHSYISGILNTFNMDPEKDFIVFALGKSSKNMQTIVRDWWLMTYWGWPQVQLALLNGSVSYGFSKSSGLSDSLSVGTRYPPVNLDENGEPVVDKDGNFISKQYSYTMSSNKNVQTDLHIYFKDMMDIISKDERKGYFIADARGSEKYNGEKKSESVDKNCGQSNNEQCYLPIQGHIRGAVDFPHTDLLIMDDYKEDINDDGRINEKDASYKFKSLIELETIYTTKGYKKEDMIIAYSGIEQKSTLIAFSAYTILKYPITLYAGTWLQWAEMAYRVDVNGVTILPEDSFHRTDKEEYTEILDFVEPEYTQSAVAYKIDLNATKSNRISKKDKHYESDAEKYRYLKLRFTKGSEIKISELDWIAESTVYPQEAMTSNKSIGFVASGDAEDESYKAFDNNINNGNHIYIGNEDKNGSRKLPFELNLDLASPIGVTAIRLTRGAWCKLEEFEVYGSNDNKTWTMLHTETDLSYHTDTMDPTTEYIPLSLSSYIQEENSSTDIKDLNTTSTNIKP